MHTHHLPLSTQKTASMPNSSRTLSVALPAKSRRHGTAASSVGLVAVDIFEHAAREGNWKEKFFSCQLGASR